MSIPQDVILSNLNDIADVCDGMSAGTLTEQTELRQAITYIRNLYGRTVSQGDDIRYTAHRLGLANDFGQKFRLPEEPFDLVVGNVQKVSAQCGAQGVLDSAWGDEVRQAVEYIGNLRQVISDWQKVLEELNEQLNDGTH